VQQTRYLHRDHLRSVAGVTDESGAVVESYSYDVWGKRRNSNWTDAASQLFSTQTPRGYTGHEQLDHASLVHMNGRVYDPNIGRMLSPDPFVQFAGYSQSFNRYSYVLNNPLSATDPSGYMAESIVAGPWGFIAAAIRGIFGRSKMRGRPMSAWEMSQARTWTEDDIMGMLLSQDTIDAVVPGANGTVYNSTSPPGHSPYSTASADGQGYMGTVWGRAYAGNRGTGAPTLRTSLVHDPNAIFGQMMCDYVGRSICEAPAKILLPDFKCLIGIGCTGVQQATEVVLTIPVLKWVKWLRGAKHADEVVGAVENSADAARALPELRRQYEGAVEALGARVPGMRQAGMSSEQIARALHAERNALKVEYRKLSPADDVRRFEARNMERYGDPLGPSIEQLRAAGKSWDDIIESAARPGGSDLGF
jgi:RHS repeat-associated protein